MSRKMGMLLPLSLMTSLWFLLLLLRLRADRATHCVTVQLSHQQAEEQKAGDQEQQDKCHYRCHYYSRPSQHSLSQFGSQDLWCSDRGILSLFPRQRIYVDEIVWVCPLKLSMARSRYITSCTNHFLIACIV